MSQVQDRLMEARCRLMIKEPWYGHIAMAMEWKPSTMDWIKEEESRTMGVRILAGGRIECLYYPKFVETQTLRQLYGAVQHEIEHIVRLHCVRRGSRDPLGWNIAADMTINGRKGNPRIGYKDAGKTILPLDGQIVFIPDDWPENETAEQYYDRFPKVYVSGQYGNQFDDHSVWSSCDISEDEARQVVKDLTDQATSKAQGKVPGHLEEALKELNNPVVKWAELLRRFIGRHCGNRRETYSRRDRRKDLFGLPGFSHHAAATISIVVDTSGSVSQDMLCQFFTEIEAIAYKAKISVLQWDHGFQGFDRYRRNAWRNFKINGRGGTDMAAPVAWLEERRAIGDVCIMFTDGFCNWPTERPFPMIFCIQGDNSVAGPGWGHEVRIPA